MCLGECLRFNGIGYIGNGYIGMGYNGSEYNDIGSDIVLKLVALYYWMLYVRCIVLFWNKAAHVLSNTMASWASGLRW